MLRASGYCSGSQGCFPTQDIICGSGHLSVGSKEWSIIGGVWWEWLELENTAFHGKERAFNSSELSRSRKSKGFYSLPFLTMQGKLKAVELQWDCSILFNMWNSLLQGTIYNLKTYEIPKKRSERYFSLQWVYLGWHFRGENRGVTVPTPKRVTSLWWVSSHHFFPSLPWSFQVSH